MYFRKKSLEDIPQEDTQIWSCQDDSCKCWMRDNFAFEQAPLCPSCGLTMTSSVKMLPSIQNSNVNQKVLKKGTKI